MVAAEARGFLLGPALALAIGAAFVLGRKPGKLPHETVSAEYLLEYGSGQLELHPTRSRPERGCWSTTTCWPPAAPPPRCVSWWSALEGEVAACSFLVELEGLGGRERLAGREVHSLLSYAP